MHRLPRRRSPERHQLTPEMLGNLVDGNQHQLTIAGAIDVSAVRAASASAGNLYMAPVSGSTASIPISPPSRIQNARVALR